MQTKIERVTVEGVELLIGISTIQCEDGVTRNIADPFPQVEENGCTLSLALSGQHVSERGIQDAILVAQMPNRDGDQ